MSKPSSIWSQLKYFGVFKCFLIVALIAAVIFKVSLSLICNKWYDWISGCEKSKWWHICDKNILNFLSRKNIEITNQKYCDYQSKWFMNNSWEWLRKGQSNKPGFITEWIETGSAMMPLARSLEPGRYRLDAKLNIMILYFSEIHLSMNKSPCKIYLSAYKKSQVGHRNSTPLHGNVVYHF